MKLFFLHIPKTAGTSLAEVLRGLDGEDRSQFHIEGLNPSLWEAMASCLFASGHLYLEEVLKLSWSKETPLACVFRDPTERLASHLRYMDRYNQPEFRETYEAWPAHVRLATDRLAKVDFECPHSLMAYLSDLSPWETLTFDNAQVRFLVQNPGPGLESYEARLDCADADNAIGRLSAFQIVGLAEAIDDFVFRMSALVGRNPPKSTPKANPSLCRRTIDTSATEIRRALQMCCEHDQVLYEAVTARILGGRTILADRTTNDRSERGPLRARSTA